MQRIIKALEWMTADMKWRHNETKRNFEDGSEGGYSPELTEAISLLEEIRSMQTTENKEEGSH